MTEFRIANTFTDSLWKLTNEEQQADHTTSSIRMTAPNPDSIVQGHI